MPLDAMVLTALRRELENTLIDAKVDRISMPEKDMLILSMHSREKGNRYFTWPGAIFATFGIVGMSLIFSVFIAVSARYSLVYGSLASVILLMYWIYLICQVIYIGAAINVSLRDLRKMSARQRERKENEN